MNLVNKMNWDTLTHEYSLDGKRLLPWDSLMPPFEGAWCVVRSRTASKPHINYPPGEEELFVCISGKAKVCIDDRFVDVEKGDLVYIPNGVYHYIENPYETDFHLYSIWWNQGSVQSYLKTTKVVSEVS